MGFLSLLHLLGGRENSGMNHLSDMGTSGFYGRCLMKLPRPLTQVLPLSSHLSPGHCKVPSLLGHRTCYYYLALLLGGNFC